MRKQGDFVLLEHRSLSRSLEAVSARVGPPSEKLRFIKRTLGSFEARPPWLRATPLLRGLLFHYAALESLGEMLVDRRRRAQVALPRLPVVLLYRLRYPALATASLGLLLSVASAGVFAYGKGREGADWLFAQLLPPPMVTADTMLPAKSFVARVGSVPSQVWLVEKDGEEELWSNGLRIHTRFERTGTPRAFFVFPRDGSPPIPMGGDPVGIVYHASESDMAPLAPELSRDILSTTKDLVGWLSRRAIYHYVVDRFGQVYRTVSDESTAVHAGHSVWADEDYYYLNLNESFIGVAFESQWSAGGDVVTSAQIQAAANLTDLLRARYGIDDAMCVPHGLVSVNPAKSLIGYHADWARNFPFEALGLSNKYEVPPPSVIAFGFGHDSDLVARLGGKLWPGVAAAEAALEARAREEGVSLATLKGRLRQRYRENLELAKLGAEGQPNRAAVQGGNRERLR